jgi:NAD(P)-dependent dehydrogenase (short-subunit alcohol dehydrogenase family)
MTNRQPFQKPLGSGFGATTTAEQAIAGIDLTGKIAIVTGGYSGLGLETTRVLTEAGATVLVPARTLDKARQNLEGMARIEIGQLDLGDPQSIDVFAADVLERHPRLDLLINCAGIMAAPLNRDSRGLESQLAVNHLGHFQLTARLWPALLRSGQARVVSVSSRGHQISGLDFEDPNFERRAYDRWVAYGQSKTANILFAIALNARGKDSNVRAVSAHPGSIETDLMRFLSDADLEAMGIIRTADGKIPDDVFYAMFSDAKTVSQGAATIVWSATSQLLSDIGGVYCEDCDVGVVAPEEGRRMPGVKPSAIDLEASETLWTISEQLTGVRLTG